LLLRRAIGRKLVRMTNDLLVCNRRQRFALVTSVSTSSRSSIERRCASMLGIYNAIQLCIRVVSD
jgi:hypothetical protein